MTKLQESVGNAGPTLSTLLQGIRAEYTGKSCIRALSDQVYPLAPMLLLIGGCTISSYTNNDTPNTELHMSVWVRFRIALFSLQLRLANSEAELGEDYKPFRTSVMRDRMREFRGILESLSQSLEALIQNAAQRPKRCRHLGDASARPCRSRP